MKINELFLKEPFSYYLQQIFQKYIVARAAKKFDDVSWRRFIVLFCLNAKDSRGRQQIIGKYPHIYLK